MKPHWNWMAIPAATWLLMACGGGGGDGGNAAPTSPSSVSLQGTVAVGAPVPNARLSFQCAQGGGENAAQTDANGAYQVNLSGAQLPCVIGAEGAVNGQAVHLFGAASQAGTANVTPFTHLLVATALNGDPSKATTAQLSTLDTAFLQRVWDESVKPMLMQWGITVDAHPGTTPFNPVAGDAMDDALEALQAKGVTPNMVQEAAKLGNAAGDELQRQQCLPKENYEFGTCWRVQTPQQPDVQWAPVNAYAAGNMMTLGGVAYPFYKGDYGPTLSNFSSTFTTEGGFTLQACNGQPAKLQYQLISPKAKVVTAARWKEVLPMLAQDFPEGWKLTMQQNCKMLSGEDPSLTSNNTSLEVFTLTVKADGSATMHGVEPQNIQNGKPYEYHEQMTAAQLENWWFGGQPAGGDDNWKTYATVYEYEAYDGPVFAVSLKQKPNAGISFESQPDMFGAALLLDWDGYKNN